MSLTNKIFQSSFLQVALNLAQRLIGIASTMILARVLTPNDFGIIAILALTTHLIDVLSDMGAQNYIIQKQGSDDDDLNTAWTLDILAKSFLTILIWVLAPYIATYLDNPLLTDAIRIISLSIPIRACRNPQLIVFAKELNYKPLFNLNIKAKIFSFGIVMLALLITGNYWAIVIGDIAAALFFCVYSYHIHPRRPKVLLTRLRNQWQFSQWSFLRGLTGYLRSQIDLLMASKLFPTTSLGSYHLQREVALLPAFSLVIPATEPLLAAVAEGTHDTGLSKRRIHLCIVTLMNFLLPAAVIIHMFSEHIVWILLGQQWVEHHQLLANFSMMFFAYCLHALLSDCMIALGKIQSLFYFDLFSTVILIGLLAYLIGTSIIELSFLRGCFGLLITISLLAVVTLQAKISGVYLIGSLLPAILSTFSTYCATSNLLTSPENLIDAITMISLWGIFTGFTVIFLYISILFFLNRLTRNPSLLYTDQMALLKKAIETINPKRQ